MIDAGKHAVIVGKTGSGKSQQLLTQALENKQSVIILDTKLDDDFLFLATPTEKLVVSESYEQFVKLLKKNDFDYLIVRPADFELSNPTALDNYLKRIYELSNDKTVFLDEAYQFHSNAGRAENGLISLLTRGRSKRLSLVCCTQRPVWISKFILSESSYFFVYELMQKTDRKAIADVMPYSCENPEKFHFHYFDHNMTESEIKPPIKIFKRKKVEKPKKFFF